MDTATLNEETTAPDTLVRELVVADRCDRCGAQAWVHAIKESMEIMFCWHHGKEHQPALESKDWLVLDYSDKINENPSVSANAL